MFVEVDGIGHDGGPLRRSWHLLAEGDDGPFIPSMAVVGLVRKALDGHLPPAGARAAVSELELGDYEKLFAGRAIYTGIREDTGEGGCLYASLLGAAWEKLPVQIREMHDVGSASSVQGRASVERGSNIFARLAAAVIGFPKANPDTPVHVRFDADKGGETWTRTFGTQSFFSRQFAGQGRSQRLLCERFGPLTFAMALVAEDNRLALVLRRWSVFGVPLPMWLCPRSDSYETADNGRFNFHVEISHPLVGLIVRYKGWLLADQSRVAAEVTAAGE